MYLPVHFGDPLAEYWAMVNGVYIGGSRGAAAGGN
jgi:hypothetical protein